MIVSGGQQSDSAIHIHVSILPQTPLPSRLPCNIEESSRCCTSRTLLVIHFRYSSVYMLIPNSLTVPFPIPPPTLHNYKVHSPSVWVCFCFVNKFILYFFLLIDSTCKECHKIFLLFWLISLSMTVSRSIHVAANSIISFFMMTE